jgi:hypothetical protein
MSSITSTLNIYMFITQHQIIHAYNKNLHYGLARAQGRAPYTSNIDRRLAPTGPPVASPAPPLIRNPINYGCMQVEAGRWWTNQQLLLTSLSAPATGTINHTPNCRSLGSGPAPTSAPAAGSTSVVCFSFTARKTATDFAFIFPAKTATNCV